MRLETLKGNPGEFTLAELDRKAVPRWFLWDGGFLLLGRSVGETPVHDHHAVQIVISSTEPVAVSDKDGVWREGFGVIVKPDVSHGFNGRGAFGAMIFIDPEATEGMWLRSFLKEPISVVPLSRIQSCREALMNFIERPFEALDAAGLTRYCVQALCAGALPNRRLDTRITQVLESIRASDNLRMPLADVAASVFLSPSRFAHLFKQQVGLPYRRYVLWRKLARAMLEIGRDVSIAEAAQLADFADAAHLTRTFQQMFGTSPSALMRGEFFEISSPFQESQA